MMTKHRVILVDALMASIHIQRSFHITIKPATIRQWAARGHIRNYHGGARRYDLREVIEHARSRGLIAE